MCGRFWTVSEAEGAEGAEALRRLQEKYPERDAPRGLVVPTLPAAVLTADGPAIMRFSMKSPFGNGRLLNARSETLLSKPTFSAHFRAGRRCLVPAAAFHEPTADKKGRRFSPAAGGLLYMAALYRPAEQEDTEFVIITRAADAVVALYHDRMPLLLPSGELREAWLRSDSLAEDILRLDAGMELVDMPASGDALGEDE